MNSLTQSSPDRVIPPLENEWSRFEVKRAWLFGSRSTGNVTTGSDWDFLVEFSQPPTFDIFMGLRSTLEERLQGRVDLLSRTACARRFLEAIEDELIDVT
ncbi:MAG: nucleotidyltransferase family protein [Chthoniobacterales bacterium]